MGWAVGSCEYWNLITRANFEFLNGNLGRIKLSWGLISADYHIQELAKSCIIKMPELNHNPILKLQLQIFIIWRDESIGYLFYGSFFKVEKGSRLKYIQYNFVEIGVRET